MNIKPLTLFLILLAACVSAVGCTMPYTDVDAPPLSTAEDVMLRPTSDVGEEYLNGFIFLGESTTYHLIDRAVLPEGKNTKQVWAPRGGTVNLDVTTPSLLIVYPETGEEIPLSQALAKKQPRYLLLTFGLNGAVQKVKKGADYFKACYKNLIDTVLAASPTTTVILQSAPPIASNMDMSRYSVDASTLNDYITTINQWSMELCRELSLPYLNSAEVLCNGDGFLRDDYQVGDGHHLTAEAYRAMLYYIRTHACILQDKEKENA